MNILDHFKVVLPDTKATFMFGQDPVGPRENFAAIYRTLGDATMADADVGRSVRAA